MVWRIGGWTEQSVACRNQSTAAEAKNGKKNDFPYQVVTFDATPKEVYYLVVHRAKGKEDKVMDIFIPDAIFPDWATCPSPVGPRNSGQSPRAQKAQKTIVETSVKNWFGFTPQD